MEQHSDRRAVCRLHCGVMRPYANDTTAVQILVDGREVDTLAGHVDLRRPLERNMKWVTGWSDESEPETAEAG